MLLLANSFDHEALLIHIVCVLRFYVIELDIFAQDSEVLLVLLVGISGVTIAVQ